MVPSILQSLRDGTPIDINKGSFGTYSVPGHPNISATFDWLTSLCVLTTGIQQYTLFNPNIPQAQGGSGNSPAFTNVPAEIVPGGERWDLFGLKWYAMTASGAATQTVQAAFRAFVQSGSYVITLGQVEIRNQPLSPHFGNKGFDNTFLSTVTAATTGGVEQTWNDPWPDDAFLTVSTTVKLKFMVNLTAPTQADANGIIFGAAFPRLRAAKMA